MKQLIFTLILLLLVVLTACGGNGEQVQERAEGGPALLDNTILETYLYLPDFFPMPHVTAYIQRAILHEGRITYAYVTAEHIVIESMLPDGGDVSRMALPVMGDAADVAALHFTAAGNLALILTCFHWTEVGSDVSVFYVELDPQGREVYRRELEGMAPAGGGFFHIGEVIFTEDGGMALLIFTDKTTVIYLFDDTLSLRGPLEPLDFPEIMGQTRDGRVLVIDRERDAANLPRPILREIDLEAGITGARDHHLNFLDDGRLSLLVSLPEGDGWYAEHIVLTPRPRGELAEREIITLGGWLIEGVEEEVIAFNRSSHTHKIQLREYMDSEAFDWDNPTAGLFQFYIDILTGQGPDILFGFPSTLAPVVERGKGLLPLG